MSELSKVAFVVPTKNRVAWIGECLTSIMDQTVKDIEIIIVNDGSDDGTKEFLDEWATKDPRVIVVHNEASVGGGASRNIGMNMAAAPIICIMDDDDVAPEDRAEVTLRWFNEHPESELVQFPYMRIGYFGEHLEPFWGSEFDYDGFKKNGAINYFCNPSVGVKTASLKDIGGYPSETKEKTDDVQFVENWIKAGKKIEFDRRAFGVLHRVMPRSMMSHHRGWNPAWVGSN